MNKQGMKLTVVSGGMRNVVVIKSDGAPLSSTKYLADGQMARQTNYHNQRLLDYYGGLESKMPSTARESERKNLDWLAFSAGVLAGVTITLAVLYQINLR